MDFCARLEAILTEKNIKKKQLETELGITKDNFKAWRRGSLPSAKYIIELSQYLNISTDELLGLTPRSPATENEIEIITLFRQLPDKEQIKFIGRLEEAVNS